jgi:hypothetical protein
MRILDRVFGRRADPTKDWPTEVGEAPECDLSRMAFGPLCFGSPIEAARCFGRPDRFRWKTGDYCELLYARAGFQLDFEEGRLVYVAFFIGEDESSSLHPTAATAQPRLRGGARLTRSCWTTSECPFLKSPAKMRRSSTTGEVSSRWSASWTPTVISRGGTCTHRTTWPSRTSWRTQETGPPSAV